MFLGMLPEILLLCSSNLYTKLQCAKEGRFPDKFANVAENICRIGVAHIFGGRFP